MRVVIVGGGHAGGAAALALRDLGFGGEVTIVGDEPDPPYERPPLSKELLTGAADAPPPVCADWSAQSVTLVRGRAVALDRAAARVSLAEGATLPFDRLILATGGHPRRPPFPPHPRIFTLRDAADARTIRAAATDASRAVILGGGVIGLEAAASLRHLGLDVAVVEAAPRLMARNVPADMGARLAAIHEAAGIRFHLNRRAAAIAPDPLAVTLDDGTTLPADLVVIGIGIVPESTLADAAGLGGTDSLTGGIPVNAAYRTADSRILAIGDVASVEGARRDESWAHAAASARAAARTILGLDAEPRPVPWFWTTQHGHTLQVAGDPLAADGVTAAGPNASVYHRGDTPIGVAVLDAPREFARLRRTIGGFRA